MADDPWANFNLQPANDQKSADPWAEFNLQPASSAPSSALDFVKSIPRGIIGGLSNQISAGGQAAQIEMGQTPDVPSGEESRDILEENITGPLHKPETTAGKYGATVGEFLGSPSTYLAPGGLLTKGAIATTAGLGSEAGGQMFEGTKAEPVARIVGAGLVAPYLAKTATGVKNAFSPQTGAAADLARAIVRDKTTPEALLQRASELNQVRPGIATIADAGGENVRGLVERVAQTPGAGRTVIVPNLTERQQGQMRRIADDLTGLTGTKRSSFQAVKDTMAQRAESAAPVYERAYNDGDFAVWSPELERLSSSPTVRSAMQGSVRIWRDNAIADGFGAMNPGALVDRGGQLSFLSGQVPAFPNLQFWDYTKRLLDDRVRTALKSGQNQKARTMTALTQSLRNELDTQVPTYKAARDTWAGPSQYLDAIEDGRNILSKKVSAEELAANFSQMGEAVQEGYRIGAVGSIVGKMGNDPAKMGDMTKYLRSPEVRDKITSIMPTPEAAAAWQKRLDFEVSSSELTGRSLGNSATARRMAERQDADNIVGDLVLHAFAGAPPVSLWKRAVMAGPKWARDTLRSKSDNILAEALTTPQTAESLKDTFGRVRRNAPAPSVLRANTAVLPPSVESPGERQQFADGGAIDSILSDGLVTQDELDSIYGGAKKGKGDRLLRPPGTSVAPAIDKAVSGAVKHTADWVAFPSRYAKDVEPEVPGQWSEADQFREDSRQRSGTDWGRKTGYGMVFDPVPAGMAAAKGLPLGGASAMGASKIGTGEGAQAYGHGLYFAEAEPVARAYRDQLARGPGTAPDIAHAYLKQAGGDFSSAIRSMQQTIKNDPRLMNQNHAAAEEMLHRRFIPEGRMYEVNINAKPEQFLDWDAPLAKQPRNIQDASALLGVDPLASRGKPSPWLSEATGIKEWEPTGYSLYQGLRNETPAHASAALREAGIPGIKYLDQGSRKSFSPDEVAAQRDIVAGLDQKLARYQVLGDMSQYPEFVTYNQMMREKLAEMESPKTSNYVMFPGTESLIAILRKYGLAGVAPAASALGNGLLSEGEIAKIYGQGTHP